MNTYMNNKTMVDLVIKWRIHLVIIAVIAGIVSVVFSSPAFIKPKYKSFAVVYPDNLGEYSEESETEQMLEILNSGDIRDQLVAAFKLDEHYNISKDYKYYRTAMLGKYSDNVTFRKTENEAVKIEVMDTDPQMASDMVDSLLVFYDQKVRSLHNKKYKEELDIRMKELERNHWQIDSLELELEELGTTYGVMESIGQSEGISTAYFNMLAEGRGNSEAGRQLREAYNKIAAKSPTFSGMLLELEHLYTILGLTQGLYNDAYREYNKSITYTNVITHPFASDKKAWPKRSVIVLGSVILTLILALIIIAAIENRHLNKI